MAGQQGGGGPGPGAGCALTFAVIPVSVSFCRSRHRLASGPRQPPTPARGGRGSRPSRRVARWGGHGLAPGIGGREHPAALPAPLRLRRGPSGRWMEGRQGDKSQRPRGEAPSRLQRRARLRVLRSRAPTEPRSARMRPAANFLSRLPQGAPAPRSADGRGRLQSPARNIALGSKVALMAASLHPMRLIQ